MSSSHREAHVVKRIGWLRASVLGANDGLISTSSLVMGVAAANIADSAVFAAGLAGLVGGALSMAAGEYVSVSSQADSEKADLARERVELATPAGSRGTASWWACSCNAGCRALRPSRRARDVEAVDPLAAHARMELGITDETGPGRCWPHCLRWPRSRWARRCHWRCSAWCPSHHVASRCRA